MEQISWDRAFMQRTAMRAASDDAVFERMMAHPSTAAAQMDVILPCLRVWALNGAQSVQMPHTYAAALCATETRQALGGSRMPWPAFEIQVQPGCIPTKHGDVSAIFVAEGTHESSGVKWTGEYASYRRLSVIYFAGIAHGHNSFGDLANLSEELDEESYANEHGTGLAFENRLWTVITRLVGGVILSIEQARSQCITAFSGRSKLVTKRDRVKPTTWALGKPLKLDCRESVAAYLGGAKRSAPSVTTLVRGHWTHQPHGPGGALRRLQWRQPHWRGAGPILVRDVRIGEEDT